MREVKKVSDGLEAYPLDAEYNTQTIKLLWGEKGCESLHTSQVAHLAGAYPGFCSMQRLGVFVPFPQMGC